MTITQPSVTSPSSSPYICSSLQHLLCQSGRKTPHFNRNNRDHRSINPAFKTPNPIAIIKISDNTSIGAIILNAIDHIINTFIDPPLQRPFIDPKYVLSDNFAPVDELPPTECEVFFPCGPYHRFNNDGMLHSIRISKGKATFCSRYVKTYKYTVEHDAGSPFDPINGIGVANTSLAFFGGRLYVLCESDLPYAVRLTSDGDIEMLGHHDFDGKLSTRMIAHPKMDVDTGETFAFRYGLMTAPPFLTDFRFDANGIKQADVLIYSMGRTSFLHDFAITKKYAIFADTQIGIMNRKPMEMIVGGKSLASVEKVRIDLKTGMVTRQQLSTRNLEFGVIIPAYAGKKNKMEEKPHTSTAGTAVTETSIQPSRHLIPSPSSKYPITPASVVLKRRAEPSLPAIVLNAIDHIINTFIDPPLQRPFRDPKYVLSDNFAPVDELPPTECDVIEGSLPPCLDGAYIRNGPNPQFFPRGPYHCFDGDGMLHSIRISKGKATFCSRYVKTYKYTVEHDAGFPVFPNIFSSFHSLTAFAARGALTVARVLFGQFDPVYGIGVANTSLAFFGGRLYALCESDLPYAVRLTSDGDIETPGRHDFDGQLSTRMIAHPKTDVDTGETFAFRYGLMTPPFLTYFRFDANGIKQADVPIYSMGRTSLLHDFAITKKYAIFADTQIGIMNTKPMEMIVEGKSLVGFDSGKMSRVGIIPRYARDESEIRWFDVPDFNIFHAINAWDEEDDNAIVMVAPNISSSSVEHNFLERMDLIQASVEKVRIDLKTGMVTRQQLSNCRNLEFGVINPAYAGKKNKYVYAAVGHPNTQKILGVVKLDVSDREGSGMEYTVASRIYGPSCYGSEPFFVAREPEDDGSGWQGGRRWVHSDLRA
ncbi:hypothetical protein L1049_012090 [Liquidambar formosana]|uniref:Carotenoid cleavage dioxygenase 4, chloroplastic n=1 Tax=Liquidambar formosana TaxID=63359 RepID=A0AAP0RSH2_LIQFO